MDKVKKGNDRIEIIRGGGCTSVFGLPFMVMGLVFFISNFTQHAQMHHSFSVHSVLMIIFSVALMLIGLGLMFGRVSTVIDGQSDAIQVCFRMLFSKQLSELAYQDIDSLILKSETKDGGSSNYVLLAKSQQKTMTLLQHSDVIEALEIGHQIAGFTGIKLDNRSGLSQSKDSSDMFPPGYSGRRPSRFDSKKTSTGIGTLIVIGLLIFVATTSGNWDWKHLKDYRAGIVYVDLPESHITYTQPGLYAYPVNFYQYAPTMMGNDKRTYLDNEVMNYQLTVQALDTAGVQGVIAEGKKLRINESGYYAVVVDIKFEQGSKYSILKGNKTKNQQKLIIKPIKNAREFTLLSTDQVPSLIQQRAGILDTYFVTGQPYSYTELHGVSYLNASSSHHIRGQIGSQFFDQYYNIPFGKSEASRWKRPATKLLKVFLQAYQGKIYSFGGIAQDGDNHAVNWVYTPTQDEWQRIPETPGFDAEKSKNRPTIAAAYVASDKLFVLVEGEQLALYQFIPSAAQPWKLIKQFSLPSLRNSHWQYLNETTLFTYNSTSHSQQTGYIQLLDLKTGQVSTLSAVPSFDLNKNTGTLLSPEHSVLHFLAEGNRLYGYHSGQFYCIKNTSNSCQNMNTLTQ